MANTAGTWRAGVEGAQPGVIMPAAQQIGDIYYQVVPGIAEDVGRVSEVGQSVTCAGQTYSNVAVVMDNTPTGPAGALVA